LKPSTQSPSTPDSRRCTRVRPRSGRSGAASAPGRGRPARSLSAASRAMVRLIFSSQEPLRRHRGATAVRVSWKLRGGDV
jgi:hypothetical protein